MHKCSVRGHDHRRQRGKVRLWGGDLLGGDSWLIVGENLVDTECDIGKLMLVRQRSVIDQGGTYQERAFDRVSSAASNSPSAKEYSTCNGGANENSIKVTNFRECRNAVKEVDRT